MMLTTAILPNVLPAVFVSYFGQGDDFLYQWKFAVQLLWQAPKPDLITITFSTN